MEYQEPSLRKVPYIISQLLWVIVIVAAALMSLVFPKKNKSFLIHSAPVTKPWDSTFDPDVIAHLTDTHLTGFNPSTESSLRNMLNLAVYYNTTKVVLTGDMADSFNQGKLPKYSNQNEPDWKLYRKIIDDYKKEIPFILDIPGNHDMFGVYSLTSPHSYIFDYSDEFTRNNTKTIDDFQLRYVEEDGYGYIIVSPYTFPTVHTPLMFWADATTKLLDRLEAMIEEHPNSFLLSHYPADMWNNAKSSSGHTFKDICGGEGVRVFLSGHSHPQMPEFHHHGTGGLESIGAGAFAHGVFSIITVDNDRLFFHPIDGDSNEIPDVLITHPVPLHQQSARSAFVEKKTEIRALVYGNKVRNASIYVSGAITGKLEFQRIVGGDDCALYSMPMELEEGKYTIQFSGDYNEKIEFVVGETLLTPETTPPAVPGAICAVMYLVPVFWVIILMITLPFNLTFFTDVENWIEGADEGGNWLVVIFCGPLLIRDRISKLSKIIRWILFIIAIAPIIVPTVIMETEGHYGVVWTWGYVMGGYPRWAKFGWITTLLCLLANSVFPLILASGLSLRKFHWPLIIDAIFGCLGLVVVYYFLRKWACQIAGLKLMWCSPGFVFMPIVTYSTIIVLIWKAFRDKNDYKIFDDYSLSAA